MVGLILFKTNTNPPPSNTATKILFLVSKISKEIFNVITASETSVNFIVPNSKIPYKHSTRWSTHINILCSLCIAVGKNYRSIISILCRYNAHLKCNKHKIYVDMPAMDNGKIKKINNSEPQRDVCEKCNYSHYTHE